MPSFFGYLLRAGAVLIPLFLLLTFLAVRAGSQPALNSAISSASGRIGADA